MKKRFIEEEVKVKEIENKRIREDEEDPDISEIEEDIPYIDEDNDGMSKACNFKKVQKKILWQIDKELGLPKVRKIWLSNYITKGPEKKWSNGLIKKKTKKWFFSSRIIQ